MRSSNCCDVLLLFDIRDSGCRTSVIMVRLVDWVLDGSKAIRGSRSWRFPICLVSMQYTATIVVKCRSRVGGRFYNVAESSYRPAASKTKLLVSSWAWGRWEIRWLSLLEPKMKRCQTLEFRSYATIADPNCLPKDEAWSFQIFIVLIEQWIDNRERLCCNKWERIVVICGIEGNIGVAGVECLSKIYNTTTGGVTNNLRKLPSGVANRESLTTSKPPRRG